MYNLCAWLGVRVTEGRDEVEVELMERAFQRMDRFGKTGRMMVGEQLKC